MRDLTVSTRILDTLFNKLLIMPIEHNWLPSGLHTQYIGVITGNELVDGALKISGDPRFDNIRYIIDDFSKLVGNKITIADVERLVACIGAITKSNPYIKNAMVLANNEESNALIGLYVFLASELTWQFETFSALTEAQMWVDEGGDDIVAMERN